jgi:hypothetical protein
MERILRIQSNRMIQKLSTHIRQNLEAWWLVAIAMCLVVLTFVRVHSLDFFLVEVDQQSHLNFARLLTDSLTPSISQLGFWPPLLHILLAPFASIDALYLSGVAGAFAILPLLFLAGYFLYKTVYVLTEDMHAALFVTLLFFMSPYVLYYGMTSMMEIPFFAVFLGAFYFLARWLKEGKLMSLVFSALFVGLSSLARFEGLTLIIAFMIACVVVMIQKKYSFSKATALFSLVLPLAFFGLAAILLYGFVYAGDPLEFIRGEWSALAQEKYLDLPSQGSLLGTLVYFLSAVGRVIGSGLSLGLLFAFAFIGFFLSLLQKGKRTESIVLGMFSIFPAVFVLYSLYTGHTVIYLETLPPYKAFFNERYGLVLLPALLVWAGVFLGWLKTKGYGVAQFALGWWIILLSLPFLVGQIAGSFPVIQGETKDVISWNTEQKDIGNALCGDRTKGQKTLFTRAVLNTVPYACPPLSQYILESNDPYYAQALERPWLFASHVILLKEGINAFALSSDKVTVTWSNHPLFSYFYEPVTETNRIVLYRVRPERVKEYAQYFGLQEAAVPVLSPHLQLTPDSYIAMGVESAQVLVERDQEYLNHVAPH